MFCEIVSSKKESVKYLNNGGVRIIGDKFDNNIKKRKDLIKKSY